jgi:hypothetical protein
MKKNIIHFISLICLLKFGSSSYVYACEIDSAKLQQAIASLEYLEKIVDKNVYSNDEKSAIESHVKNINKIKKNDFCPVSTERHLTVKGTCCTWHEYPVLDRDCWAKRFLELVWCTGVDADPYKSNNSVQRDKAQTEKHGFSNACLFSAAFTAGIYPCVTFIAAGGFALVQGCAFGLSLPCRCCGTTLDEYTEQVVINKPKLEAFIQQAAIALEAHSTGIEIKENERQILERLAGKKAS